MENPEPIPADRDAALIASFAAKVAEKAVEAAEAAPEKSVMPAREAFNFALQAIWAAGRPGLVDVLEADFEALADDTSGHPWWRFW